MPRRLIVCCDGTWDKLSHKDGGVFAPSNVAKMAGSIAPHGNGMDQVVFYDSGIGTGNALDRYAGGLVGVGISDNIKDGYQFLMHNFARGDEIYLFGFSRGAYTVRSLAGFIRKCGMLRKEYSFRIDEGYDIYRMRGKSDTADSERAEKFRSDYSWRDVPIKLIGVWDTVGALGLPGNVFRTIFGSKYLFHDVELSSSVEYGYHALAIDEKRHSFRATLWEQTDRGVAAGQQMEQAWFPGVHSDVGGGALPAGLSDEAFRWMRDKAEATGLVFDEWSPPGDALGEMHESWKFPYKVIPKFWRPIDEQGNGNESISDAAIERWYRDEKPYRPPNLVSYFEKHAGPPPRPAAN